jgi:hypothetical protein
MIKIDSGIKGYKFLQIRLDRFETKLSRFCNTLTYNDVYFGDIKGIFNRALSNEDMVVYKRLISNTDAVFVLDAVDRYLVVETRITYLYGAYDFVYKGLTLTDLDGVVIKDFSKDI